MTFRHAEHSFDTGPLTCENRGADTSRPPGSSTVAAVSPRGLATPLRTVRLMSSMQAHPCDEIQGAGGAR